MEIAIDVDRVLDLLDEVAAERPDYVYPREADPTGDTTCRYWHEEDGEDGLPGCIVGTVLYRQGVTGEELTKMEGQPIRYAWGQPIETAKGDVLVFTEEAIAALNTAQVHQDGGETWGYAAEHARSDYEEALNQLRSIREDEASE